MSDPSGVGKAVRPMRECWFTCNPGTFSSGEFRADIRDAIVLVR